MANISITNPVTLIHGLECQESCGSVRSLVFSYIVNATLSEGETVGEFVEAILRYCPSEGAPAMWGTLLGSGNSLKNLVCTERTLSMIEGQPNLYELKCTFMPIFDAIGLPKTSLTDTNWKQMLAGVFTAAGVGTEAFWVFKSSGALGSTETSRYPLSAVDPTTLTAQVGDQPIVVWHTYPSGDPDYPGRTVYQGAKVTMSYATSEFEAVGLVRGASQLNLLQSVGPNYVNRDAWMGGLARTWCITSMEIEPFDYQTDAVNHTYRVRLRFQHDPFGWDTYAVFTDPRTGQPPQDLVYGEGIQRVVLHPAAYFGMYWPTPEREVS